MKNNNRIGILIIVLGVVALLGIASMQGCNLGDIVTTDVPPTVQDVVPGTDATSSLNEAVRIRGRYVHEVTTALGEFDENIAEASLVRDTIASFLNTGIEVSSGPLATIPGGGFLALGLGSLGGLFLRKPGTTALIQQEKEASFNAGLKKAQQVAVAAGTLSNATS